MALGALERWDDRGLTRLRAVGRRRRRRRILHPGGFSRLDVMFQLVVHPDGSGKLELPRFRIAEESHRMNSHKNARLTLEGRKLDAAWPRSAVCSHAWGCPA